MSGSCSLSSTTICHSGLFRKDDFSNCDTPLCTAPNRVIPALLNLSIAPIHNATSGFTGFLTNTGISTPFSASAISCTANGLAVVLAPIQSMSIPAFRASPTCFAFATSIATGIPNSFFTRCNQASPILPTPSKLPGFVLGFQIPAL